MSYLALYRKFRPETFEDVKGQDHIVTTLRNQLKTGRTGHAYLFCGTRGTGKTTVARILAKAVNCENPQDGDPCGECEMCRSIKAGNALNVIEIDAASNNSVDNIREIREEVQYRPTQGNYKVYIIDEVHMLSVSAFNALLKTLEEPPSYVMFILATMDVQKIPVTILSRCQRYDFHRITPDIIADRLAELLKEEKVEAEEKALRFVARAGDGSMRDALSLLDQCIAFYPDQKLTYEKVLNVLGAADTEVFSRLFRQVLSGNVSGAISILEELLAQGRELSQFVGDFTWYLRNLLLARTSETPEEVVDMSAENLKLLKEESTMVEAGTLMRYIRVLSELSGQIRFAVQKRVLVEIALIRLCRPQMETDTDSVLDRIRVLERRMDEAPPPQVIYKDQGPKEQEGKAASKAEAPASEKAAPEDLQKIMAGWNSIIQRAHMPLRAYLAQSRPRFMPDEENPVLYVEMQNDSTSARAAREQEKTEELQDLIRSVIGRQVEVKVVLPGETSPGSLKEIKVDEMLKNIHMEIEEED